LRKQRAESLECRLSAKAKELTPTISGLEESEEFSFDDESPRKKARLLEENERQVTLDPRSI
jgi:hypothetical protein